MTGAGPVATRASEAEAALRGSRLDDAAVSAAAAAAGAGIDFLDDIHASGGVQGAPDVGIRGEGDTAGGVEGGLGAVLPPHPHPNLPPARGKGQFGRLSHKTYPCQPCEGEGPAAP